MAGFRSPLFLLGLSAVAAAPPAIVRAAEGLSVRAFHGEAGEYIEDWDEFSAIEISFSEHGPDTARVDVPSTAEFLHHTRSFPAGVGVLLSIDGTGLGVPDVWCGRLLTPQFDGDGESVGLALKGPEEWLSRIGVPMTGATPRPAADVVREALQASAVQTWVRMASAEPTRWSRVPFDLSGQALWPLMTGLAETRGEEFYLTARPGMVAFDLSWSHPLDAVDASAFVTLVHGENCSIAPSAFNLGLPLQDAIGVALSYGEGAEVAAALVKAPPSARLGLRDALTAALTSLTVRRLAGAGGTSETIPAPEITSEAALVAMLEATLRREMAATCVIQVQDVDPDLWPHLRPGTLVGTAFDDPFGLFSSAVARIRTATFRLAPELGCSLSCDLWATEAAHG